MAFLLRRLLPPYRQNLVFAICGAHILFYAIVLAIHQTFWLLSTQIFPTAYQMFDDTHARVPDFAWNKTARQQLDRYQIRVCLGWAIACLCLGLAMMCILPFFCKAEVAEGKELDLCIRQPSIALLMTPLFVIANFLVAATLVTEWADSPADDQLFHRLFNGAIKEEAYLTSFEDNLNCLSDEDKEGFYDVWKCDRMIERAILNRHWLGPLLIVQFALTLLSALACLLFNNQEKISRDVCNASDPED